jgi:hypothetical protein
VSEPETEAHLSLEAMLPRVVPPAVRLVLLELAPEPESLLADAAAEGVGAAAPLAGEGACAPGQPSSSAGRLSPNTSHGLCTNKTIQTLPLRHQVAPWLSGTAFTHLMVV